MWKWLLSPLTFLILHYPSRHHQLLLLLDQMELKNPSQQRLNLSALLFCLLSQCILLDMGTDELEREFAYRIVWYKTKWIMGLWEKLGFPVKKKKKLTGFPVSFDGLIVSGEFWSPTFGREVFCLTEDFFFPLLLQKTFSNW